LPMVYIFGNEKSEGDAAWIKMSTGIEY